MSPLMSLRAAAALLGMASVAAAAVPLAPINNEQSGAAAWVTASYATNYVDVGTGSLIADPVFYTVELLTRLNKVTTPAALRAQPGGISIPCKNEGNVTARLVPGALRMLSAEWNDCVLYNGLPVAKGPLQILLPKDSFAPGHVLSVAMGSAQRDFVLTSHSPGTDESADTVAARNVRMIGWIPVDWTYHPEGNDTAGYTLQGFEQYVSDVTFADPNRPPEHIDIRSELKNGAVWITNSWKNEAMYYDDDWHYLSGDWTQTYQSSRLGTTVTRWSVDNLRIHRITDYENWNGSYSYDGGFSWTWPAQASPGCLSGRFAVRTKSPFTIPSLDDSGLTDSGELAMNNGAATYKTYSAATVPPGFPTTTRMLLSMSVRNAGTFNYDQALWPEPVRIAANCQ